MENNFQVKFSRWNAVIGLLICLLLSYIGLDMIFFHILPGRVVNAEWISSIITGLGTFGLVVYLRTIVNPPLIFSAGQDGITITGPRAGFATKRVLISWEKVISIGSGSINLTQGKNVHFRKRPALRIEFDSSIDLSGYGYFNVSDTEEMADNVYLLTESCLPAKLEEAIQSISLISESCRKCRRTIQQ